MKRTYCLYCANARACGAARRVSAPIPLVAWGDALAARRLRVPELTPTPRGPEGEVGNTTALLRTN